jgi:hypothetical protein
MFWWIAVVIRGCTFMSVQRGADLLTCWCDDLVRWCIDWLMLSCIDDVMCALMFWCIKVFMRLCTHIWMHWHYGALRCFAFDVLIFDVLMHLWVYALMHGLGCIYAIMHWCIEALICTLMCWFVYASLSWCLYASVLWYIKVLMNSCIDVFMHSCIVALTSFCTDVLMHWCPDELKC